MHISRSIKTVAFSLAAFILMVTLLYLYFFSKSGYFYESKIKSELVDNYGIHFQVLDRIGRNSTGYERLVMAPSNNRDLRFVAELVNGSYAAGGLPYWRKLADSYDVVSHYYYYPKLMEKHFGIQLTEYINSYWENVEANKPSYFDDIIRNDREYSISVSLDNIDEVAKRSRALFEESDKHYIYKLYYKYVDPRLTFAEEFTGRTNTFEIEGIKRDPNIKITSDSLLSEVQIKEQLMNQLQALISRDFEYRFEEIYPRHQQAYLHSAWFLFQPNLTDYHIQLTINDIDETHLLAQFYEEYVKAVQFASTMPDFHLTEVRFKIWQDEQDRAYVYEQSARGAALDRNDFIERLQRASKESIE